MKTIIILVFALMLTAGASSAQSFKGHISGSYGIINPKVRVQYESPLKDKSSVGININYYFENWTGPVFEPFFRFYFFSDKGNSKGFFLQPKLMYGNLSTLDYETYKNYLINNRWSTWGIGLNVGFKVLAGKHITIEPLTGFRFLTPPVYRFSAEANEEFMQSYLGVLEDIGWYLTTGMPIDFQIKFGYQF